MGFKSAKLLIATIGLGLGSAAIAEALVYYGTDSQGAVNYYDTETIRRYSNNTVEVWRTEDASKDKTVSWRTQKQKVRIDCSAETFSFLSIVTYRANGTVMESSDYEFPKVRSIVPGSPMNTLFKIMCPR